MDFFPTTQHYYSVSRTAWHLASGSAAIGGIIGDVVDMLNTDSFTNLYITGRCVNSSGELHIAVQTSDTTTSGDFTDPTSGMSPQLANWPFPTGFQSGGIFLFNSGGDVGVSGQTLLSGFFVGAGFLRPHRYARANGISGFQVGAFQIGFIGQLHTTGSGGGFWTTSGIVAVTV